MSLIDKIVGLVPTVRDKAKAVLGILNSKAGKIGLAVLFVISVLGFTHHMGVRSQEGTIEQLKKELGSTKLQLAAAEQEKAKVPVCPDPKAEKVGTWLDDQAKAVQAITIKPKPMIHAPVKRPARKIVEVPPSGFFK
ncbi:hypothetical protein [Bradyrhizobium sp. SZCCHNRI2010]|uniref:hypothetical protein n=1 Tax=Bradyrhizobium sp. SZCCHNRI2010 TaxID=3057283 RepID=UPI0028ED95FF|nr:hypothetical protein [Bradyrhizobium sp. SZCCHNRI2010]